MFLVAFDVLEQYDEVDFGFTPTDAYSEKFDWFGFGSINYVEALGTTFRVLIVIFVASIAI